MSILLPNWPLVDQMTTWTNDGQPSEDAEDDCAYTCVAMFMRWATGEVRSPNFYHDAIAGQGEVGVAYSRWIASYLRGWGFVVDEDYGLTPWQAYQAVRSALAQGDPAMVLSNERLGRHYTVGIGENDDGSMVRANPNGGVRETLAAWDWQGRFAGDVLVFRHGPFTPPPPAPAPKHGHVIQQCGLKPQPSHAGASTVTIPARSLVDLLGPVVHTDDAWVKIGWGHGAYHPGYVLASNVRA